MRWGYKKYTLGTMMLVVGLTLLVVGEAGAAKKMPSFSEKAIGSGETINSNDLIGKVLLINFWATWCPPCREEIPVFKKFQTEYGPKGFSVIGVSIDQGGSRVVEKFVKKMKMNYPVFIGGSKLTREFGGVIGIPASFLVDRDGNLVNRYDGFVSEEILRRDLEKQLN